MNIFIEWMAPIAAICIGIMILAGFFSIIGMIKDRFSTVKYFKMKKFLKDSDCVSILLSSGKSVSNVRFVGFTDSSSFKGLPYSLANMLICETQDNRRIMIRADTIRMIEQENKIQTTTGS